MCLSSAPIVSLTGTSRWDSADAELISHSVEDPQLSMVTLLKPWRRPVERQKLARFWHAKRHDNLSKTIFQCTGDRRRDRQQGKCWLDKVIQCTTVPLQELLTRAVLQKRLFLERISAECSLMCPPTTQSVKGLN